MSRLPGRLLRVAVVRSVCITTHRVRIAACIHSRLCLSARVAGGGCVLMLRTQSPDRMSARRAGTDLPLSLLQCTHYCPPCQLRDPGHFRAVSLVAGAVLVVLAALGGMLFVADCFPAA